MIYLRRNRNRAKERKEMGSMEERRGEIQFKRGHEKRNTLACVCMNA